MKIFRSIRWRLLIWYGALLGLIVAGLGTLAYQHERTTRLTTIDLELQSRTAVLANALKPGNRNRQGNSSSDDGNNNPNDGIRPEQNRGNTEDGQRNQTTEKDAANSSQATGKKRGKSFQFSAEEIAKFVGSKDFYYAVQANHRDPIFSSNAPSGIDMSAIERSGLRTRGDYREAVFFAAKEDCVLAGVSMAGEEAAMRGFLGLLIVLGAGVLAIALTGGWILMNRALRPIDLITAAAGEIAAGDLSRRIDIKETESELGGLADLLNTTFSRLNTAFARLETALTEQARFTADAAHELRTPVSVILTYSQIALLDKRLTTDQRETIATCERAAQRMRCLIESLLRLARLDARESPPPRESVDLVAVTAETLELLRPAAALRNVTVTTSFEPTIVHGDVLGIGQVVSNLIDNAIFYGRESGSIRVSVSEVEDNGLWAQIEVADNGPGIPAEHAAHIFNRFYRVDKARTGTQGRTGLGLAISKAIVEAHGGTISLHSREGQGATFTVRLPRAGEEKTRAASDTPPSRRDQEIPS